MSKFKYEPYKGEVDKDRIKYDDAAAYNNLTGNGKGDVPRHDMKPYSANYELIDWNK